MSTGFLPRRSQPTACRSPDDLWDACDRARCRGPGLEQAPAAVGVGAAVGLHLAIDYSIRVGFLSFVAITALTSFISPDASAKAILTARDLLATTRRRHRPASPVSARSASADALRTGSTR